jgi:hypothetical protein
VIQDEIDERRMDDLNRSPRSASEGNIIRKRWKEKRADKQTGEKRGIGIWTKSI